MLGRKFNVLVILFLVMIAAIPVAFSESGNVANGLSLAPMPTPADKPAYSAYKGVGIGTAMDDARSKLGTPKEKSDTQDFFVFSDNETAAVYYGPTKIVTAITVTFTGKIDTAPSAKEVFGEDVEAKPDGGVFKLAHYPKAGFWISYNKTGGSDPLIMIAIQKM